MPLTSLVRPLGLAAGTALLIACADAAPPAPASALAAPQPAQSACAPLATTPSAAQAARVDAALAVVRQGRVPESASPYMSPPGTASQPSGEPRQTGFYALDGFSAWIGDIAEADAPARRLTLVWDETREAARLAHIHLSEPTSLGGQLATIAPDPQGDADSPLRADVEDFWSAWTDTDMPRVTANYVEDDSTLVILPWVPDAFRGWSAFRDAAQGVIDGMDRFGMSPSGAARTWRSDGAALTVGTWEVDLEAVDGAQTRGDGRYTLLWRRCEDGWRVQHEHLSSWAAESANSSSGDQP